MFTMTMNIVFKNRRGGKYLSILICLSLMLFLTGCKADSNVSKNDADLIEEDGNDKNEVSVRPSDTEEPKIEDFSVLDEYFKDYTFDVTFDENLEFYDRIYTIHGTYDLNGDGEEEQISALLNQRAEESYIEVNGIKVSIYPMSPTGEVQIIDLDNRDEYVELAIFDDGPSGDPEFKFFRYDGKELISLGSIERGGLMDGQGKLISWFNKSNYLVPLETNPENHFEYTDWDFESLRKFKNTEIMLLDIHISPEDRTLNWYYVELPDGERGLLCFWIGD